MLESFSKKIVVGYGIKVVTVSTTPAGDILFITPLDMLFGTYRYPSGPNAVPLGVFNPVAKILVTPEGVTLVIVVPVYLDMYRLPSGPGVIQSSNVEGPGTKVLTVCE
jgi:hypothetical protein